MNRVRRRPRLAGVLAAIALALAPALPSGIGALAATGAPTKGYWFVAGDGGIFSFGDATFAGSTGSLRLNQPIVGMTPTPTGRGYWFVAADGGIFSFGDATFAGSTGKLKLNRPIVGMAPTPTGRGYWFVAADGGIFSFGDAAFYGSTGAIKLAKPIVGMAATPTGRGYWFVASDGGIFNYGDAAFYGSAAGTSVRSPIISMIATPTGRGYYLASADGTVRAFGDAVFRGSMGGKPLTSPIVGIAPTSTGAGYWLVAADGGIFSFGDAAFYGSTGSKHLNQAIVGMAAAPQKTAGGTAPGGTTPGGGTLPGGGTDTTVPGGGTTDTTLPPANNVNWGAPGTTSIIAKAGGGGNAYRPWMSADGRYVVFDSDGKRVMGGTPDPVGIRDIYLYDRTVGSMTRISTGVGGARANVPEADSTGACSGTGPCGSQRPTISADGRFVAFWSSADNLVGGDTNKHTDAFLVDRQTGTTTLISKGFQGAQADGDSKRPVVSRDGRYVGFESAATNLVAPPACGLLSCTGGDTNKVDDVFLYEVATGSVTRISTATDGTQGNAASDRPSLSGNGRRILFQSDASNLVAGDGNRVMDIFMRDLDTGQTTLVSSNAANQQSDKMSESPSISADGRWVSFDTKATNFNLADAGGDLDVYVKDLQTGAIDQASVQSGGGQATGTNGATNVGADSTISSDGRFVSFWSDASSLVPGDTNGSSCANPPCADVFVRDRAANTTTRITSTNGVQGDGDSFSPAISMDGRFVAIDSKATTLDPSGGGASNEDVFVHVNY
jgi:Tol biopolymer transport system component